MSIQKYIPKGVAIVQEILSNCLDKFLVYYDADLDGVISGFLCEKTLSKFNKTSKYYINNNRQHGFKLDAAKTDNLRGYTIFAVDFSMSRQEIEELTAKGINIINIDHHTIKEEELVVVRNKETGAIGVVINNQYSFEPEHVKYLSGAGMVYYVLKALFPKQMDEDDIALVGLSLLADIRPIENDGARGFLRYTYNLRTPYMQYLVDVVQSNRDYGFGKPIFDRNYIEYTFSPKVNALLRLNKGDEAIQLIKGNYPIPNNLDRYRLQQNDAVAVIFDYLLGGETDSLIYKGITAGVEVLPGFDACNFIGLACSKQKNVGKTSFLHVHENGIITRGSVRGLLDNVDYLSIFRKHGVKAEGHKNAFGVLPMPIKDIDFDALSKDIRDEELAKSSKMYEGRVIQVQNLSMYTKGANAKVAEYNNYVRDTGRVYLRYAGDNVKVEQRGKMWMYMIDGVQVKSFDESVNLNNGLILPILERGEYVNFYLKKIISREGL